MDEQTQTRVRNWLKRADEYLRASEVEFQHEFYARAISTAYYAMFYAATAALASIGIERSKHSGVVSAFGEHFIKTRKIGADLGRALRQTMEDRELSDYDETPVFDRTVARARLDGAQRFKEGVVEYLRQQGLDVE